MIMVLGLEIRSPTSLLCHVSSASFISALLSPFPRLPPGDAGAPDTRHTSIYLNDGSVSSNRQAAHLAF